MRYEKCISRTYMILHNLREVNGKYDHYVIFLEHENVRRSTLLVFIMGL
jgi:hypothetical protein